jgi:thiol-disulfide isomerase/thioredoxin
MPSSPVLPAWYAHLQKLADLPRINSGCSVVNGNVNCSAEKLLKQANDRMAELGLLKKPLTFEELSLARYIDSEGGSGTPSEKVAIGEAARNRARIAGTTVDGLLRRRQKSGHPNHGWYGPIHATESECAKRGEKKGCAPYGRWASTKRDPSPQALIIAQMILSGETRDFAKGADDQMGPDAGVYLGFGADWVKRKILAQAEKGSYWVGLLPGVNHRKTFLFRSTNIKHTSAEGQKLIEEALKWAYTKPDWSKISTETGLPAKAGLSTLQMVLLGAGGLLGTGLLAAGLAKRSQRNKEMAELSRAAEQATLPSGKEYVVFSLDSCPACEEFKPKLLEKISEDKVAILDVESPEVEPLAYKYNVELLPTAVRVSDGAVFPGISDPSELLNGAKLLLESNP